MDKLMTMEDTSNQQHEIKHGTDLEDARDVKSARLYSQTTEDGRLNNALSKSPTFGLLDAARQSVDNMRVCYGHHPLYRHPSATRMPLL